MIKKSAKATLESLAVKGAIKFLDEKLYHELFYSDHFAT